MKTLPLSPLTRRGESWRRELEFLRASIAHAPGSAQSWWWRMRAKIVTYLLARYGRDSSRGSEAPPSSMPAEPPDVEVGPRKRVAPRPGMEFRGKLDEIRSSNEGFRHSFPEESPPRFAGALWRLPLIVLFFSFCLILMIVLFCGFCLIVMDYVQKSGHPKRDAMMIFLGGAFIMVIATWFTAWRVRR
ncbi:MAG: hypothetical protein ABI680_15465 [Chthoniobacteraceae bacterium]